MQMHRIVDIKKSQDKLNGININCEACGENYDVQVKKKARNLQILESFAAFFAAGKSNFIKGG